MKMHPLDQNICTTKSETDICKKESKFILETHDSKENIVIVLPDEDEVIEVKSEDSSNSDDPLNSSIISISSSSIDSPPECKPNFLENYKTPHSQRRRKQQCKKKKKKQLTSGSPLSNFDSECFFSDVKHERAIPNAIRKWPGCVDVWLNMVYNEEASLRSRNVRNSALYQRTNNAFMPRMRAILVDWIMEVCEVYQMRRNTYYLAIDYVDRFLEHRRSIPKAQLQLVGVSCLFIAAKLEEIYPPKLSEFVYVCDGACNENEILICELLVLKSLDWDINPMTPTTWLNLYMQIACMPLNVPQQLQQREDSNPTSKEIYFPVYSAYQFVRANQVIDLFSFDPAYARFSYSIIAATAMYIECGELVTMGASGFIYDEIDLCVKHMAGFHNVLCDEKNPRLHSVMGNLTGNDVPTSPNEAEDQMASYRAIRATVPNLVRDENHSIQTHCVNLDYYERAVVLRLQCLGFKIHKVYSRRCKKDRTTNSDHSDSCMKKKSIDTSEKDKNDEDTQSDEKNEDKQQSDTTMISYKLQRLWDHTDVPKEDILQSLFANLDAINKSISANKKIKDLPLCQDDNIFDLPIYKKQFINFDTLLSSVHLDCTDEMFLTLWQEPCNFLKSKAPK